MQLRRAMLTLNRHFLRSYDNRSGLPEITTDLLRTAHRRSPFVPSITERAPSAGTYLNYAAGSLVRLRGVFGAFQLHFEPLGADLEAVHGLDGRLRTARVVVRHEACNGKRVVNVRAVRSCPYM